MTPASTPYTGQEHMEKVEKKKTSSDIYSSVYYSTNTEAKGNLTTLQLLHWPSCYTSGVQYVVICMCMYSINTFVC